MEKDLIAQQEYELLHSLGNVIRQELIRQAETVENYPTWIVYAALSMELCSLAVFEGMSAHSLMEGILSTYRKVEKHCE